MDESQRQGTARRDEILDVAARLFGDHGMRTSVEDIAEACDLHTGSLYHHFSAKEEIYFELVARYGEQLDRIADQALSDPSWTDRPALERVTMLGTAMAECAVRNRAALLLTLYVPPTDSGSDLADLANRATKPVRAAMGEALEAVRANGCLAAAVDLELLADRVCQAMFRTGLGVYGPARAAQRVPAVKCQVILHGAARLEVTDELLDESPARRAADAAIASWIAEEGHETAMRIRAGARSVFARSGYELTTVRDIAAAAGMSASGVYRHVESKDELFWSILRPYTDFVADGWNQVVSSSSTPIEKLDGLLWLLANSLDRFAAEYRMELVALRYAPPNSRNLRLGYQSQLRQLKRVLDEGVQRGELDMHGPSMDVWARCIMALLTMPESIVRDAGLQDTLQLGRHTVLRGVATCD